MERLDPIGTSLGDTPPAIGRYVIRSKLGEGGMAEVFLADLLGSKGFRRPVVLKVLREHHLDDEHQQDMFTDEAKVGSRIEHPHVPRTLELGDHEGRPFIVQEYVEGPSFQAVLKRARRTGGIDVRFGVRVVVDVAKALHHAYHLDDRDGQQLKVVHRDVSPSNILVSRRGITKLIDFGVARFEDREAHTDADVLKGKLRYLAPETMRGKGVSHRSDLYALGIVLYQATTGHAPWRRNSDITLRLRGEFTRPSKHGHDYPAALEAIVLRCMATDPDDRYTTGHELAEALEAWLVAEGGGAVTDARMAEWIEQLFPGGPDDWLPRFEVDMQSIGHTQSSYTLAAAQRPKGAPTELWGIALGSIAVLALLTAALVSVLVQNRPLPQAAAQATVHDEVKARDDFEVLLQHADTALDRRQVGLAKQHLTAIASLPVTDAALRARADGLWDRLDVVATVRSVRATADDDLTGATEAAAELLAAHPHHPDVEALVDELEGLSGAGAP